jgi:hypothetical protein
MTSLLAPNLTAYDPQASEGGRDPLGLEAMAGRLADQYLPAVTSRMSRIRALTVIAVGAHTCQAFADDYTADDTAPAWLVFEWIWAEAVARSSSRASAIPGIDTARRRLRAGERLSTSNYLKGAMSQGLHGFYRTLALNTLIIDGDGYLDENGERLIRAWETDQGLAGLLDDEGDKPGGRLLRFLRKALEASLAASACAAPPTGEALWRLADHLAPEFPTRGTRERVTLRSLLDEDEYRRATLSVLESKSVIAHKHDVVAQAEAARAEAMRRSEDPYPEVGNSIWALVEFERLSATLTTAFDLVRYRSTQRGREPAALLDLADPSHGRIVARLPSLVANCEAAFSQLAFDEQRAHLLTAFSHITSVAELLRALVDWHLDTQRSKGAEGKLSWFTAGELVSVRSAYALNEPPPTTDGWFVHPTRLPNAAEFLSELA